MELWDEEEDWDPSQALSIATAPAVGPDAGGPAQMIEKLRNLPNRWWRPEDPADPGGEHTITRALVEAYLTRYPRLTIVCLDAHADLRDKYENSPWSHACAMRRVWELGRPVT